MVKKIIKGIKNPRRLILYILNFRIFRIIPDKMFLMIKYKLIMNRKLNLKNPITFNEKLQWLKLYDRKPEYIQMVDKYEVRKYIKDTIGEEYLIPLIGVYNKFEDIDLSKLPNQFVLKCTHDSGGVVICRDKSNLDIETVKKKINNCLKRNYYYHGREWPYKNIKPRIICEKYMVDESGYELKDYKFFCFNGEPRLIQVDFGRYTNHQRNLYSINWEFIDAVIKYPNDPNKLISRPKKLEEMLKLARVLSKGIPHVRVDFYYINGNIYFGEMTFYHGSGFEKFSPEKLEIEMGNWISLPRPK